MRILKKIKSKFQLTMERRRLKKAGFLEGMQNLFAKTEASIRQRQKIEKKWPGLGNLINEAGVMLSEKGLIQKHTRISDDIRTGQIPWIPEQKRVPANIYVKFRMAGIKMSEKNLKALGLKGDTASLDKLIENY